MSIISKALEKEMKEEHQARRISGVQELPGVDPAPNVSSIIQQRSETPRSSAPVRRIPSRPTPAALPNLLPTNFGKQFFVLGGLLAIIAVGVGFFMADSLTPKSSDTTEPPSRITAAAASAPATQESVQPAQTPVVVRVEVAVRSEPSSNEPVLVPVDRQTLFESKSETGREQTYPADETDEEEAIEIPEPPAPPKKLVQARPSKLTLEQVRAQFKVDGIFYGDGDPMTIINDEIVREGQETSSFSVVKIKPDSVIIRIQDADYELR